MRFQGWHAACARPVAAAHDGDKPERGGRLRLGALHILAENKNNQNDKCEMMRLLLDARADPDARGRRGATPLFKAASTAATSQARVLLHYGADVNVTSEDGTTPLDATWANKDCRDVIRDKGGKKGEGVSGKGRSESS